MVQRANTTSSDAPSVSGRMASHLGGIGGGTNAGYKLFTQVCDL